MSDNHEEHSQDVQPASILEDAHATPPSRNYDSIVDGWWNDHFPGSAVGLHTDAWNHARLAVENLKARLRDASRKD